MFERYTDEAKRAVFFANWEAQQCGATCIDTLHLLLGICHDRENRANRLFHLNEWYERLRDARCPTSHAPHPKEHDLPLDRQAKITLARAADGAGRKNEYRVDSCHILAELLRETDCLAAQQLSALGITLKYIQKEMGANSVDFDSRFWQLKYLSHLPVRWQHVVPLLALFLAMTLVAVWVWSRS